MGVEEILIMDLANNVLAVLTLHPQSMGNTGPLMKCTTCLPLMRTLLQL
jgi:hypothetical protein